MHAIREDRGETSTTCHGRDSSVCSSPNDAGNSRKRPLTKQARITTFMACSVAGLGLERFARLPTRRWLTISWLVFLVIGFDTGGPPRRLIAHRPQGLVQPICAC